MSYVDVDMPYSTDILVYFFMQKKKTTMSIEVSSTISDSSTNKQKTKQMVSFKMYIKIQLFTKTQKTKVLEDKATILT